MSKKISESTRSIVASNLYYLIKLKASEETATKFLLGILNLIEFIPHELVDFTKALTSQFQDKEDVINYINASRLGLEMIITRNIKDFKHADIPVTTPAQFLLSRGF